MARPKKQEISTDETIKIPPIEYKYAKITIVGETPLLVHKFSEKAKKEISDKQQKKAKAARDARNPEQEYKDSMYVIDAKKKIYGMPASGLKLCAVSACRYIDGIKMTTALGSFHVIDDFQGLVPIVCKRGPQMDERFVSIGNFGSKVKIPRYRGRFDDWSCTFTVKYNSRIISGEQLLNLYENAGFAVGLCENRPERKGNLGMFTVKRS